MSETNRKLAPMSNNDARTDAKTFEMKLRFGTYFDPYADVQNPEKIAAYTLWSDGYDAGHAAALERPEMGEAREIVKRLHDDLQDGVDNSPSSDTGCEYSGQEIVDALRQLLDAVPQQWVETSERLPLISGYYLATYSTLDGRQTVYVYFNTDAKCWYFKYPTAPADCILAWMETPAPMEDSK